MRVYDEAVGRHVAATFWTIRDAHDPERYLAMMLFAADTGWGTYREMEPGEYDTYLFEFDCRGEPFVADSAYVRRRGLAFPVTIRSGERVDREVRIDSRQIDTDVSYANSEARRCDGAPGPRPSGP